MQLMIENVRCFRGRHIAPLAPLTILVGENSSGKSTLLAMARSAWDAAMVESCDFNEAPFRLGAFNDIVTQTAEGRAKSFSIGYLFQPMTRDRRKIAGPLSNEAAFEAKFTQRGAHPTIGEWRLSWQEYSIVAHSISEEGKASFVVKGPSGNATLELPGFGPTALVFRYLWQTLPRMLVGSLKGGPFAFRARSGSFSKDDAEALERLIASVDETFNNIKPYASAPIRTRPERTYDPLTDKPTPEGDHVPMVLAKREANPFLDPEWRKIRNAITDFGSTSGMFQEINVSRLGGDDPSHPFQLRVGMKNDLQFNLVDVGYGVSQVLPILLDALSAPNRPLLLQQPEVHLHPRAQAQLGSFLGALASQHRTSPILVETHSDYLVDRIRMDIRDQKGISNQDVLILYCERTSEGAAISPIRLDDRGNLVDVPAGYRSFFMEEERRFLQA